MDQKQAGRVEWASGPNPNFRTSLKQIPIIFRWYSFPGTNTLKIIDVIKDSLQSVVSKKAEPDAAINEAAKTVAGLVPGARM